MKLRANLMNEADMQRALKRMSHEIAAVSYTHLMDMTGKE